MYQCNEIHMYIHVKVFSTGGRREPPSNQQINVHSIILRNTLMVIQKYTCAIMAQPKPDFPPPSKNPRKIAACVVLQFYILKHHGANPRCVPLDVSTCYSRMRCEYRPLNIIPSPHAVSE